MATLIGNRLRLRGRLPSERGAEILEFAIVTPLLCLVIAALIDFGILFRNWEVVTNAAREGARVGMLPSYSCDAGSADVQDRVASYLAGSGITDHYDVDLQIDAVTAGGHTFSACVVNVTLEQGLPSLLVIGGALGGSFGSVTLGANAVMRTESQAAVAP
jgi:Flp pilus assembly protein TadG